MADYGEQRFKSVDIPVPMNQLISWAKGIDNPHTAEQCELSFRRHYDTTGEQWAKVIADVIHAKQHSPSTSPKPPSSADKPLWQDERGRFVTPDYAPFQTNKEEMLQEDMSDGNKPQTLSHPPSSVEDISEELLSDKANELWERLRSNGFIQRENHQLIDGISNNQATYIACRMSEMLELRYRWKPFQDLWGIHHMAQLCKSWESDGQTCKDAGKIDKALGYKRPKKQKFE